MFPCAASNSDAAWRDVAPKSVKALIDSAGHLDAEAALGLVTLGAASERLVEELVGCTD